MERIKLLEKLQNFDYFIVNNNVSLETENKRGIMQTSIYDNVELIWKNSAFKFWNDKCEDISMVIHANIKPPEWNKNIVTIHIKDCCESVVIKCSNKH